MFKHYKIRDFDFKLVFMIWALALIGVIAINSAEPSLRNKQLFGVVAGTVMMLVVAFIDYSFLLKLNWLMYIGNLGLLVSVLAFGSDSHGAQRWLEIGGITFQPSETAKILLILFFAQFIMKHEKNFNTIRVLALCVILAVIPWYLIYKQPDLSTSIVFIAIFCVILFAGGISLKIVFSILAVAIPALALVISMALQPENNFLTNYQKRRILSFIHPEEYAMDEAYQQLNSVTAIASGMLNGKGYMNNEITSVKNGNFISEAQTDFIFSIIGEEFGFKGSVVVIAVTEFNC